MKQLYPYIRYYYRAPVLTIILVTCAMAGKAQLYPLQTMYFQNQYLYNPAMAGMEDKLDVNFDYRQQWSDFPGTPKTGTLTADFQPVDKVGVGVIFDQEQYGLIKQTLAKASYAYHLPLNGTDGRLNFGLSLGINNSRINYSDIVGDASDAEVAQYNQMKPYVDGDLGIAYTSDNLSIGGTLPNIRETFFKTSDQRFDSDELLFIALATYKFPFTGSDRDFVVEPLAAFRVVRGYTNIFDAGVNLNMKNTGIYIQGVYETSRNMNVGFGYDAGSYGFTFAYNFETGEIGNYTNGAFEVGVKLRL
jgi:type IX secretion system PorP/SprF family membrane protein